MKNKKIFTILYQLKGGEYMSQVTETDENAAAVKFIKSKNFSTYVDADKNKYLKELSEFGYPLLKISRMRNVWIFSLRVKSKLISFHVVETAS